MGDTSSTNIASALRAAADLLEAHPDLPAPMVNAYPSGSFDVDWLIHRDENQRETMHRIRRAIGGTWEKNAVADLFYLSRKLGDLRLMITTAREQVCVRRVVGQETVTVPAVEAQPEHTEVRDIVEWDCEPVGAEVMA